MSPVTRAELLIGWTVSPAGRAHLVIAGTVGWAVALLWGVWRAVAEGGVQDLGYAERLHAARGRDLLREAVVAAQPVAQHLDRDQGAVGGAAQVHHALAAFAEPADQLVGT
ncbi:hypothetical protein ACIBEJ_01260 [Nonomuraea sp. NPDC050790]|uniref:hypothetical protein n=1 Tax=Nonomuraea sp. NPDC050790 TaxID=3364371 RepID=UPI00378E9FBB